MWQVHEVGLDVAFFQIFYAKTDRPGQWLWMVIKSFINLDPYSMLICRYYFLWPFMQHCYYCIQIFIVHWMNTAEICTRSTHISFVGTSCTGLTCPPKLLCSLKSKLKLFCLLKAGSLLPAAGSAGCLSYLHLENGQITSWVNKTINLLFFKVELQPFWAWGIKIWFLNLMLLLQCNLAGHLGAFWFIFRSD